MCIYIYIYIFICSSERLAEYGWKPHRVLVAQQQILRASIYRYTRKTTGGVQIHRIRDFKQYYFNSTPPTSHHRILDLRSHSLASGTNKKYDARINGT